MSRHGGGQLDKGAAVSVGHVGFLTAMVFAVCGLGAIFWLPFKHPKVTLSLGALGAGIGALAWLSGNSDPLGSSDSVWWIPMFAGGLWIYHRWMDPNRKREESWEQNYERTLRKPED